MKNTLRFIGLFSMIVLVSLGVFSLAPLLLAQSGVGASPGIRIATIDMQKLFNEYHRTVTEQAKFSEEHKRIQKENEERLAGISAQEKELQQLKQEIESSGLAEDEKQEQIRQYQVKVEEARAGVRVRKELIQDREKAYRLQKQETKKILLGELQKDIVEYSEKKDFDLILDKSGFSSNQVTVVVHSTDAIDITAELLEIVNRDAPADTESADGKDGE